MTTLDPAEARGALRDLGRALRSTRAFIDVLEMCAEQACAALEADSLSLSEWDRDLGRLVTRVNVGTLAPGEIRFPRDEIYLLARDAVDLLQGNGFLVQADDEDAPEPDRTILRAASMSSGVTMPVPSEGRLWGELWASRAPGRPAYDERGLALAAEVAALIGDVVASGQLLERTARMAFEDPLTRLGNRRVFDDRLDALLAPDTGPGATVILCDLDGLKEINDQSGHATGDRVITLAGDALSVVASKVEGGVATRIGGDEFAILLPGEARARGVSLAHQASNLLARGRERASMSCGVASAPAGAETRALVGSADAALYAAKRRGAQVVLASDLVDPRGPVGGSPDADADSDDQAPWVVGRMRSTDGPGRRVPLRRRWDDSVERPYAADASAALADAVRVLAESLPDLPEDPRAELPSALRWVGDTLLAPLGLDRWILTRADLGRRPLGFVLDSMGMSQARLEVQPGETVLSADPHPVEDYPSAWGAAVDRRMFTAHVDPALAPASMTGHERNLLLAMGIQYAVGAGAMDHDHAWVFALYGASDRIPLAAVREITALALSATGLGIDVRTPDGPHTRPKDGDHE